MSEVRVYDAPSDLVGRWVREADMQALRAENARLREALKTYAECSDGCTCGDGWSHDPAQATLTPQGGKGG